MGGTTGSRFLWTALLVPPALVLVGAGAMTVWPAQVVGVLDQAAALWPKIGAQTPRPTASHPGHGRYPFPPMARMHSTPASPTPPMRGIVRTPDGSPYEGKFRLTTLHVGGGGGGFGYSAGTEAEVPGPEFDFRPQSERCWLVIEAEGYAAAAVGPIEPRDAQSGSPEGKRRRRGQGPPAPSPPGPEAAPSPPPADEEPEAGPEIAVALERGFPHRVRVVRADGEPIHNAEVHASLTIEDRPAGLEPRYYTDEQGWAVIPHVREAEYEFEVRVHDFALADDTVFATLRPGVDTTIRLDRGPLSGLAVDEAGRPVVDALVMIAAEFDAANQRTDTHPFQRVIAATSDAEGRFVVPAVHKDSLYLLRVEGPDGSAGYAPGVGLNGAQPRVTLHPRRMVRGVIKLDPDRPRPFLSIVLVRASTPTGFEGYGRGGGAIGEYAWNHGLGLDASGRFEYPVWEESEDRLEVAGRHVPVPWPPPDEPIPIELPPATEAGERQVEIRLVGEEALRSRVDALTLQLVSRPPERANLKIERLVEIRGGRGSFRAPGVESFQIACDAIPGLWTEPTTIEPAPGGGDSSVEVRILAAGSIDGRVVDADGRPAGAGTIVSAGFVLDRATGPSPPPIHHPHAGRFGPGPGGFPQPFPAAPAPLTATTDAEGRFAFPSWPLDATCRLSVERGRYHSPARDVRPDAATPRPEVELVLPPPASAEVRLLDPDGGPLAGVDLAVVLAGRELGYRSWPAGKTDADGRIRIDDLAAGEEHYAVTATFAKDFRPLSRPLTPGGPPLEIRAERGWVLEGRVLEAVTGWPIPGLRFHGYVVGDPSIRATAVTDDDGRFRFDTLRQGDVRLEDPVNLKWAAPQPSIIKQGAPHPILVRATKLRRDGPQPRPPRRP